MKSMVKLSPVVTGFTDISTAPKSLTPQALITFAGIVPV